MAKKRNLLSRLLSGTAKNVKRAVGFEAGMTGRRLRAVPAASVSINQQISKYGASVVARSRYLTVNNPYAAAAKDAFVTAFVGSGIKPSSLVEDPALKAKIQELWLEWTDEADADHLTDFYGLQGIIAGEIFEAGECFIRIRHRRPEDGLSVPMQLQLLSSEMLDHSFNQQEQNGRTIECGIEFGPIGNRQAYWFWPVHPQSQMRPLGSAERVRVPASEVLHLFKPRQAGQIRGVPHTVAAMVRTAIFDLYDDAELERMKTTSLVTGFIKRLLPEVDPDEHPLEHDLPTTGQAGVLPNLPSGIAAGMEPGALVDLEPGEDVVFAKPGEVGSTYESFQLRNLLAIAAGYGVPYSDMTGDMRQTNYSSIRAAIVNFRRRIDAMQHHIMVFQLCRPVWQRWMQEAVLSGALEGISPAKFLMERRKLTKAKWIPPKWEWVDPFKDRQAEALAVKEGFKSRSDVIEAEGYDPEENDARIAADKEREEELGLKFGDAAKAALAAPEEEEEDENADPKEGDEEEPEEKKKPTATVIHNHVKVPTQPSKKMRTTVTGYDAKGRIQSFEQEPI